MQMLITRLHEILRFLDENELAVPAIKVEEAINAIKPEAGAKCKPSKPHSDPE